MKLFALFVANLFALTLLAVFPQAGDIMLPKENLLSKANFSCKKINLSTLNYYKKFNFIANNNQIPTAWRMVLNGNVENSTGNISFDGKFCHLIQMKNIWNSCFLTLNDKISSQLLFQKLHTLRVWAKGKGTLHLELVEFDEKKSLTTKQYRYLVTEEFHYYQTNAIKLNPKTKFIKVNISIYGNIIFSVPELSPLASIDKSTELVYYVPFDKGSSEALFSIGPTKGFGVSENIGKVPGVVNDALRLDSKRRLTNLGMLRLPMGIQYSNLGKVLNKESGTLEFYFRPLPEILSGKKWDISPLFSIGTQTWMWPGSEDFTLGFVKNNGKLLLEYKERIRLLQWPTKKSVPIVNNPVSEQKKSFAIVSPKTNFVNKWHHLAFVWNANERKIYLDGKEVISQKSLKNPCISSFAPSLYLGCISLNQPYISSCDFDELKIYNGVRYKNNFSLPIKAPVFKQVSGNEKVIHPKDNNAISYIWKTSKDTYRLRIKVADGATLIYSSKDAANNVIAKNHPQFPALEMSKIDNNNVAFHKRNVTMSYKINKADNQLKVKVTIKKGPDSNRVWLEPQIYLDNLSSSWHTGYDGFSSRPLLKPFKAFSFDDLQIALPIVGALNNKSGVALSLSPDCFSSYLSRGMSSVGSMQLKLRTVLDANQSVTYEFDVYPFAAKYGKNDLIDLYHKKYPQYFAFSNIDPRVYGNIAYTSLWNSKSYKQRKDKFSLAEFNRRFRGQWCWYYWTGAATGNWSVDDNLLKEFEPLNEVRVGDAFYHKFFKNKVAAELESINNLGITPSLYISSWAEKRLVSAYRDSVFESEEIPNGIFYWKNYWTKGVTDYIMLQSGVRYGDFLRRQISNMLKQYPGTSSFSHDLFGGDYYFRKDTNLAGMRAFDENGVYTHNLPSMGIFAKDLKNMKNSSSYKTALVSNAHGQISSFNTFFRADNNIHERPLTWSLQDWSNLQQHSCFMGEKPTTFYPMPSVLGNYIDATKDDIELIRYSLISQQHSQLLIGMLFNINQNCSILGIKESIPMIDELLFVHSLGHRQTPGFNASNKLAHVRYGNPDAGALVLINFSPEKRSSFLDVDDEYLGGTPLLCSSKNELNVRNSKVENISVAPLSWNIVEMVAECSTNKLSYKSNMSKSIQARNMNFVFVEDANINKLNIKLFPNEKIKTISLNGKNIAYNLEKSNVILSNLSIKNNDHLQISIINKNWNMPITKLKELSFVKGKIVLPNEWNACGIRIKEFFRFWGVNQTKKVLFDLQIASSLDKTTIIEYQKSLTSGISFKDNRIIISSINKRNAMDLTEELLKALETYYPYIGVFGNQIPVYDWNWATTNEQRKLLKKSNLILKTLSTKVAAESFVQYMKKNKINVGKDF